MSRPARLLLALLPCLAACERPPAPPPPERGVVIVILDTVRADHLSCYGYARPTTPAIDRLAREGERYEQAWAHAPWTLPSIATILTGQPPHAHGAEFNPRGLFAMREPVRTLAQRLGSRGWRSAAFVNVVWCHPNSGLARGFAPYDFQTTDDSNRGQRTAAATTDAALAWLAGVGAAPFLLVVHYFDAHLTYDPPAPYDTLFEPPGAGALARGFGSKADVFRLRHGEIRLDPRQRESLVARYDGELRYVDDQIARLRAGLETLGRFERTMIVVTADHGEEFWDHGGFEHGHSHHRELLHVPLVVRRPGGPAGRVVGERARLIDIAPTVLDFAGLPPAADLPGQALGAGAHAAQAVAEGSLWAGDLVSVRSDRGTLILDRATGRMSFFGPGDRAERDARSELPAEAEELRRILAALPPQRQREGPPWEPDAGQLEQLRSLGYVQ